MKESVQETENGIFRDIDADSLIKALFNKSNDSGYSIALWRLPLSGTIHCIIDAGESDLQWVKPEIDTLGSGFIFSPFKNEDNTKVLFLNADLYLQSENGEITMVKSTTDYTRSVITERFLESIIRSVSNKQNVQTCFYQDPVIQYKNPDKKQYLSLVRRTIKKIKLGEFEKAVPTRSKVLDYKKALNPIESFISVSKVYPNAFVSLVSTPQTGTWMGASPEVLISVENNEIFRTVSIAGTQEYNKKIKLSEVAWTQKEIEEQAMVGRYIINCFKKIRLREFEEYGPKTVRAGSLVHLKTQFTVNMTTTGFPQLGTVMLRLLHPTSAVCGMPKETTLKFLNENEGYEREYYSGYLGPVNIQSLTSLFVNIRCANIFYNRAVYYAGAGVTIDSNAEKEWQETEAKIRTIEKYTCR